MKKALLFVPFWGQPGHVGNNRVDRFVRWLSEDGFHVVIVRAGAVDARRDVPFGQEITVRDPLGLYKEVDPAGNDSAPRKPSKLRRLIAYTLLNPDPTVVWARLAARHPMVVEAAKGAKFILSSSPPESAHLGAWTLSRRLDIPHFVDMRDGWLDEPLKPILHTSALRRWQEARMEARILKNAAVIQVTSEVWQELLCARIPELEYKVNVLMNGYPQTYQRDEVTKLVGKEEKKSLVLIHAGRFLGSDVRRIPDLLLTPLIEAVRQQSNRGVIQLIGPLSAEELAMIRRFEPGFNEKKWIVEYPGSVSRSELLQRFPQADGLLLLSTSRAAIPSKLFEYIPAGKPIFVVTERNSATWRLCERLPQVFLAPINEAASTASKFISAAQTGGYEYEVPEDYSEDRGSVLMLSTVDRFR